MKFKELKPIQKGYVIEVMNRFNHTEPEICLSDMKSYHEQMIAKRTKDSVKIGYPNWLIKPENKVSKSVYNFPIPTESELNDFNSGKTERVVLLDRYSPLLKQVVKEYGLKP